MVALCTSRTLLRSTRPRKLKRSTDVTCSESSSKSLPFSSLRLMQTAWSRRAQFIRRCVPDPPPALHQSAKEASQALRHHASVDGPMPRSTISKKAETMAVHTSTTPTRMTSPKLQWIPLKKRKVRSLLAPAHSTSNRKW